MSTLSSKQRVAIQYRASVRLQILNEFDLKLVQQVIHLIAYYDEIDFKYVNSTLIRPDRFDQINHLLLITNVSKQSRKRLLDKVIRPTKQHLVI